MSGTTEPEDGPPEDVDEKIDDTLDDTFPASDPPATGGSTGPNDPTHLRHPPGRSRAPRRRRAAASFPPAHLA